MLPGGTDPSDFGIEFGIDFRDEFGIEIGSMLGPCHGRLSQDLLTKPALRNGSVGSTFLN